MGTKRNPGAFDCHAAADLDEPMFILLGRDRIAAYIVMTWAKIKQLMGEDPAKVAEARVCAVAMFRWCKSLGKTPLTLPEARAIDRMHSPAGSLAERHMAQMLCAAYWRGYQTHAGITDEVELCRLTKAHTDDWIPAARLTLSL